MVLLAGCARPPTSAPTIDLPTAALIIPTPVLPSETPAPIPTIELTPTPTVTPEPYVDLTIDYLSQREYGGGELLELSVLDDFTDFTRYLVSYPSDGLTVNGFVNVPAGDGPFPVILLLHGFVEPSTYNVKTYTTRYADALTRSGYLVIHPNYRNHIPSDEGPNLFRTGYAIDVLNLVAIIEEQGGQPGILEKANSEAIGLWGHSMGGGIALRVITVGSGFDAALIYGSMNSDETLNMDRIINVFTDGEGEFEELDVPLELWPQISPSTYLERISVPVSIHHGNNDTEVPVSWSEELCERMQTLGLNVECFIYLGQPHIFNGEDDLLFLARTVNFFNKYLGE